MELMAPLSDYLGTPESLILQVLPHRDDRRRGRPSRAMGNPLFRSNQGCSLYLNS